MLFIPGEERQEATLAIYAALAQMRKEWCGDLIVSCGLGPVGCAVALASHVAGAGCLCIEPDPEVCRVAMRAGTCDFLVNTVDEALRVLKNELRKKQPISVALETNLDATLAELMERGLLPQLFAGGKGRVWQDAPAVEFTAGVHLPEGIAMQAPGATSSGELKALDGRLRILAGGDWRERWLDAAPRLFYRDRPFRRAMLLSQRESEQLS